MQPTAIRVGTAASSNCAAQAGDLLQLTFGYGTSSNNGNVLSQTIARPSFSSTDAFTYL